MARVDPAAVESGALRGAIPANLFLAILVSFSEELTFRGYCLQRIGLTLGRSAGVLLSSLMIALLLLLNLFMSQLLAWQILLALCSLLFLGMALAISFLRTGRTPRFPWALHLAYNLVFGLHGIFFRIDRRGPTWWVGNAEWASESGMLGVVWWATRRTEGYG